MSQSEQAQETATLTAQNIGGIDDTEVTFSPGVTILAGRNATNRTSLLQAFMAALGSDRASLKASADEGGVELTLGGETYTRTLTRTGDSVATGGTPYLDRDEAEVAELFAFLLESNEARRTVARSGDLHELIMRPVDTEAIHDEIEALKGEKRRIDEELDELDSLKRRLPDLEAKRTKLRGEIEDLREELNAKETEVEALDAEKEESRAAESEVDERLDELSETRSELETVRFDIESQERSLEALGEERDEIETELESLTDGDDEGRDFSEELERLRNQKGEVERSLTELQSVIQFNEDMLEGTSSDVAAALAGDEESSSTESLTDQLVEDETVVCWTCGSEVETAEIEATLDRLRALRRDKLDKRTDLQDEIDDLEARKRERERTRREREEKRRQLDRTASEIESREETLETLRERRGDLIEEVERLEAAVERLESEEQDELLDLHKEVNQLEFDIDRRRNELEDVESEIDAVEARVSDRDELEAERERVQSNLEACRSRIERTEQEAVEQFNDHMESVLDVLGYANLERVWIERTEREVREGRRTVSRSSFDLHIVRRTDAGTVYEDTIDHLSESEREVTGLIFALAGYLVHDVYETVPFVLLDSLEAIDSQRIADLVTYLGTYADYLVVALLPEDAAALDDAYERISDI